MLVCEGTSKVSMFLDAKYRLLGLLSCCTGSLPFRRRLRLYSFCGRHKEEGPFDATRDIQDILKLLVIALRCPAS